MDYHHWKSPSSPWSRTLIPHSILPNHTEGHQLNGRDALSRKAGLGLGKDSTGVEEYPNQDKLHKISVLRWDSNPGLPDGRPRCEPHNHTDLLGIVVILVKKVTPKGYFKIN